jgi:DNA-binding MarR family transcriptional regulator
MACDLDVEELAVALRVNIGLLLRRLRQVPVSDELTLPETSALARLDRGGPSTAADLARAEQISPQSMGVTLAALEAKGLVQREADGRDGRRVILSLTDAAADVLASRRDARAQQLAGALRAEFSEAELAQLAALAPLLERLAQSI